MPTIIAMHSFRRGTGKSNLTANIGVLLTLEGRRVGVIDTNMQSPSMHILFDLDEQELPYAINDYLWHRCAIEQMAYDITARLRMHTAGHLFMVPASARTADVMRAVRAGYDVERLDQAFHSLIDVLKLDVLIIDTHAGLSEETLLSMVISDTLAVILRPDQQDYQGTGVIVQLARKLDVPRTLMIVNEIPAGFDPQEIKARMEQTYCCEVVGVLPHCEELMALTSSRIFALSYPFHALTATLQHIALTLAGR